MEFASLNSSERHIDMDYSIVYFNDSQAEARIFWENTDTG